MLQTENDRAHKKINETSKKAEMLEKLKEENDKKYIDRINLQQRRQQERLKDPNGLTFADLRR